MINIAPKNERKFTVQEYWLRVTHVMAQSVFIVAFITFFLLLPSFILTLYTSQAQQQETSRIRAGAEFKANQEASDILLKTREKLNIFSTDDPLYISESVFTPLLEQQFSDEYSIRIVDIIYEMVEDRTQLRVKGIAGGRNDLLDFADALRKVELYERVSVPLDNLATTEDNEFTITVQINYDLSE